MAFCMFLPATIVLKAGGATGDPSNNSQNMGKLFGKFSEWMSTVHVWSESEVGGWLSTGFEGLCQWRLHIESDRSANRLFSKQ